MLANSYFQLSLHSADGLRPTLASVNDVFLCLSLRPISMCFSITTDDDLFGSTLQRCFELAPKQKVGTHTAHSSC